MPWIPLERRSKQIVDGLERLRSSEAAELSLADYYNQNDFGQLPEADLIEKFAAIPIPAQAEKAEPPADVPKPSQRVHKEGEGFDVKSLRWLRQNGETSADRKYAELKYRQILFDLWCKHVVDTGETYYPGLADDLLDHYELENDEYHKS